MKSPFDSSNMKGGPGGLVGGQFKLDIGTDNGPGGLNGSPFMTNNDGGPGGLSGGSFMQKTDSSTTDSKFDTSQYEQMLKEMFATDSGDKSEGNPFDPDSYSGNINAAGTGRTNLNSATSGQSQGYGNSNSEQSQGYGNTNSGQSQGYGNLDSGQSQGYSNTNSGQSQGYGNSNSGQSQGYGNSNSGQSQGYGNSNSGQSQGYGNSNSVQSQRYGNTDGAHGSYESGRKDSSYQFNNGNTDTYQTPFNEKTDYNELLSSPFQSDNNNGRTGGQRPDQALGTGYSPFKADRGMPGMARMNNPGGNPLSQGGSQIGRG
ncbi:uncharacterized protein LOC143079287 isoform X2 [Mytilus galloprovincialis]